MPPRWITLLCCGLVKSPKATPPTSPALGEVAPPAALNAAHPDTLASPASHASPASPVAPTPPANPASPTVPTSSTPSTSPTPSASPASAGPIPLASPASPTTSKPPPIDVFPTAPTRPASTASPAIEDSAKEMDGNVNVKVATSPPFRALIIGIDIYKHAGDTIHNLRGCVADAKNMRQYLIEKWSVSPESIVMLYNEEATRAGILENLRALKHPGVLRGAPIFIFWAGHGSRAHAASTSSIGNVFVEMLIPHDFDPKNEDKNGQGLPDFILGSEVAEIARHNGDNITVILDICHAGSATRDPDPSLRGFDLPKEYILNVSAEARTDVQDRDIAPGSTSWKRPDSTSHILLAATSAAQRAREEDGQGVFTRELLKFLREQPDPGLLTYADVIGGLPRLGNAVDRQDPQCEGRNSARLLFTRFIRQGRYRYHLEQNDRIVLEAGAIQGITTSALFDFYTSHDPDQPPEHRGVKATEVTVDRAFFDLPALSGLPKKGWAKQTMYNSDFFDAPRQIIVDPTEIISIEDSNQAANDMAQDSSRRRSLTSPHHDQQQLMLIKEPDGSIAFDLTDQVCLEFGLERLLYYVDANSDNERMCNIMNGATGFFHHLARSNPAHPLRPAVQIEAHLLNDDRPTGENLVMSDGRMVPKHVYDLPDPDQPEVYHECYGFTITNKHSEALYAWIFAFNMNDLSIDLVYQPNAALLNADPCIPPKSDLALGYGNGGVVPQAFFLPPDEPVGVTYLKVFLSSTNVDLSHIAQPSPFISKRVFRPAVRPLKAPTWDTLQVAVIQKIQRPTSKPVGDK